MSILGLQPKVPQVPQGPVGQILTHEGYAKIALVDLGREASDALRASWPAARPFQSAGVIRALRGGRSLTKSIRAIDTIRNNGFAPVRSRMERWVGELESSAAAAREESIVFYLERDGRRTLKARRRNIRLLKRESRRRMQYDLDP